jgi:hypothetical protein
MTSWPNSTDPQFLDANGTGGLNAAWGAISGAVASIGSGAWTIPGLLSPEAMTVSFSGLVATVGLPQPWGLIASSGVVVRAHGTQTGTDTQNYSVNFASLVPASGTLTAYLAATVAQIQQNPFPITGPPPGDPAYNPNFVPTVGYATNQYSVALSAVSGGINNTTTFELFRTTLTASQSTISSYNTVGQVRAGARIAQPGLTLASGGVLTQAQSQYVLSPGASGLTHTLPLVSGAGGLFYSFVNPTALWTIVTSGTDTIAGFGVTGVNSLTIPLSGAMLLWGNAGQGEYQAIATSPNMTPHGVSDFAGSTSWTVPANVFFAVFDVWGSSSGSGGAGAANVGGGAGGAAYSRKAISVVPGAVYTFTSGAGGTAGGIGTNGGTGGTTTLTGTGVNISIPTSNVGVGSNSGGGGGTGAVAGTGGDLNLPGGSGGNGNVNGTLYLGGEGGTSPFGGSATSKSLGLGWQPNLPGGGPGGGAAAAGVAGLAGYMRITW